MISEFKTIPKAVYYVQTADGCTVLDPDGDTLAEITAPGGYFPGIAAADGGPGTVTFSAPVKRVVGPFDLAPQLQLTILGQLGGNGGLPAGFRRVEYLQSDGGQVINTGLIPSNLTGYKAEVQLVSDAAGAYLCGVQNYSGSPGFWLRRVGTEIRMEFGGGGSCKITSNAAEIKLKHSIETNFLNSRFFVVNGAKTNIAEFDYTWGQPFTLFKSRYANGYDPTAPMRIFSWKHSEGTELVLDLVPCVNTDTGEPCMYDLVSKQPLRNVGTGSFVVGLTLAQARALRLPAGGGKLTLSLPHEASIDRLAQAALEQARANGWELTLQYAEAEVPAGYRKLDFLESTGTQWINIGTLADDLTVAVTAGTQSTSSVGVVGSYGRLSISVSQFSAHAIRGSASVLTSFALSQKIDVLNAPDHCAINGSNYAWDEDTSFAPVDSCSLFGVRGLEFSPSRVYSLTISRAGEMQTDYVPCISPEGKLGMYNRVGGTVKENAGSGAFIAGLATVDDVRSLWLPETSGELTVSVPADTPDSAVEQLRKNNPSWQIAIQYRTENNEN